METQTTTTTETTKTTVRPGVRKITQKTTVTPKAKTASAKPATKPKIAPKKVGTKDTGLASNAQADGQELNLKQLCNQLSKELKIDIDPRMARRKLRKAKISGHDFRDRWTFARGSKAYDAAVKLLTPVKDEETEAEATVRKRKETYEEAMARS